VKVIIDTNVFISGVFFSGPPYKILEAWRDGKVQFVVSSEILQEYHRVGGILGEEFPGVDVSRFLELLTVKSEVATAPDLPEPVCVDPDDDKFLACALAGKVKYIISGDKHLLQVTGYRGVEVIRPSEFVDNYLGEVGQR
jgi:putative PIN family toxin of toxin-antitoxin system